MAVVVNSVGTEAARYGLLLLIILDTLLWRVRSLILSGWLCGTWRTSLRLGRSTRDILRLFAVTHHAGTKDCIGRM